MFSLHDIRDFLLIVLAVAAAGAISTGLFWLVMSMWLRRAKVVIPTTSDYELANELSAESSITTYSSFPVISQFGFVGGGTHMVVKDGHGGSVTFHN